jgi:hypothetical protein
MSHTEYKNRSRILTWIAAGLATIVFVSGVLSGCVVDVPMPTPTPTRTPPPAATAVPTLPPQPTPTLTPIGAAPTATDLPPTATPLPENVNPLTGEVVADSSVLDRVPVAIKISNWPGQYVRPQAGINSADLIYEHYNEGWFSSRWTGIFLSKDPERVGPVRSGRIIDLELPAIYKAVFACSGFSNGVIDLVQNSDLYPDWVVSESLPKTLSPSPFYRDYSRDVPLEHTMYTDATRIRTWAAEHGISGRQDLQGMIFSDEPTVEGTPATTIQIPFTYLDVEWRYDPASGRYLRWSDGVAHTDALDGQQLNVANVVLLYVPQYNTDIVEDPHSGALSIRWELWYSNRAIIFRDGVQIEAFWQRWERPDMLTLTDEDGTPIPLKVGNTFFEVLPTDDEHWIEIVVQ